MVTIKTKTSQREGDTYLKQMNVFLRNSGLSELNNCCPKKGVIFLHIKERLNAICSNYAIDAHPSGS